MAADHAGEHARTMVRIALLLRLASLGAGTLWLAGEHFTPLVLVAVVLLGIVSFAALMDGRVLGLMARHPLLVVADSVLVFAALAIVGTSSPLVLASLSTALMYGVLFEARVSVLLGVMLVALYTLAWEANALTDASFMTVLGIPTLYLSLLALGMAARVSYARQARLADEAAAARSAKATSDERARLARELHDSLGKSLYGISMLAEGLPGWMEREPATALRYSRHLAESARTAAEETRRIIALGRLDQPDRPLAQVLREVCEEWAATHGVPCTFRPRCTVDVSTDARYELLAIVAESLENVARHAGAARVEVELYDEAGATHLSVRDDGRGFVPGAGGYSPPGHFGLTGMRERAELVGARLTVTSAPGRGTTVHVVYREEGQ